MVGEGSPVSDVLGVPFGFTDEEHQALELTARLWRALEAIVSVGRSRTGDLAELAGHVHAIQNAVLAQAAARAFPNLYRPLGGDPPSAAVVAPRPREGR
jgi:hypothetical protein